MRTQPGMNLPVALSAEGRRIGEMHPGAVLTDHEVGLVLDLLGEGFSYSEVAIKMEVSKSCVAHIATGRRRCQTPERWVDPDPRAVAISTSQARRAVRKARAPEPTVRPVNEAAHDLQVVINSWR